MLLMFVLLTWNNDGIIRRYDRCDNYTASMSHFKMRPALKVNRRCALATPEKMECFGAVNYDFPHLEPKVTSLVIVRSYVEWWGSGLGHNYTQLREFTLVYHFMQNLPNRTFANNSRLELLALPYGRISQLHRQNFFNLTNLRVLDLRFNKLETVGHEVFGLLSNLRKLFLDGNSIKVLKSDVFIDMYELQVLSLNYNNITNIEYGAFFDQKKLKQLHLSHNLLDYLHAKTFEDLHSVEFIDLSHNLLSVIFAHAFPYHGNLKVIDLRRNHLGEVKAVPAVDLFNESLGLEAIYFDYQAHCLYFASNLSAECYPNRGLISGRNRILDSFLLRLYLALLVVINLSLNFLLIFRRKVFGPCTLSKQDEVPVGWTGYEDIYPLVIDDPYEQPSHNGEKLERISQIRLKFDLNIFEVNQMIATWLVVAWCVLLLGADHWYAQHNFLLDSSQEWRQSNLCTVAGSLANLGYQLAMILTGLWLWVLKWSIKSEYMKQHFTPCKTYFCLFLCWTFALTAAFAPVVVENVVEAKIPRFYGHDDNTCLGFLARLDEPPTSARSNEVSVSAWKWARIFTVGINVINLFPLYLSYSPTRWIYRYHFRWIFRPRRLALAQGKGTTPFVLNMALLITLNGLNKLFITSGFELDGRVIFFMQMIVFPLNAVLMPIGQNYYLVRYLYGRLWDHYSPLPKRLRHIPLWSWCQPIIETKEEAEKREYDRFIAKLLKNIAIKQEARAKEIEAEALKNRDWSRVGWGCDGIFPVYESERARLLETNTTTTIVEDRSTEREEWSIFDHLVGDRINWIIAEEVYAAAKGKRVEVEESPFFRHIDSRIRAWIRSWKDNNYQDHNTTKELNLIKVQLYNSIFGHRARSDTI